MNHRDPICGSDATKSKDFELLSQMKSNLRQNYLKLISLGVAPSTGVFVWGVMGVSHEKWDRDVF
jgi:hypothetical protein